MTNGSMDFDTGKGLYMGSGSSPSVDSGFSGGSMNDLNGALNQPTAEEKLAWENELAKVEDEIKTLRQVLTAKLRRHQELKRKLGVSQLDDIKTDINATLKTIQESEAYLKTTTVLQTAGQKTGEVLTVAGSKTGEVLSTAGTSIKGKLGEMRNSQSFQSMSASVGNTFGALKRQVSTSMRGSQSTNDMATAPVDLGREPDAVLPDASNA